MNDLFEFIDTGTAMPALFVGHGSPMNAIEDNEFSRAWAEVGQSLPKPTAILCISAHWVTEGTGATAMGKPKTIHDFSGFPQELYDVKYPAEGSPALARLTEETIKKTQVEMDFEWGLDHGTWSVLSRMFPNADIPVVQLSLDGYKKPQAHYDIGTELRSFRNKGVLIVGSGNMVHNLGTLSWEDNAYDWAVEFDETLKQLILSGDHDSIVNYEKFGRIAAQSIPTNEHFLPLLYILALKHKDDNISFFADKITLGSISMRSMKIG
ncbi:MAG: 4,5-DOPA dioxygenase extradiol [Thermodesulfovibrio sp.]|nr:4,5-DOPA dioxygenase extradiol [Thermodesulfovibrio sp.]